jgi:hypothetical protein
MTLHITDILKQIVIDCEPLPEFEVMSAYNEHTQELSDEVDFISGPIEPPLVAVECNFGLVMELSAVGDDIIIIFGDRLGFNRDEDRFFDLRDPSSVGRVKKRVKAAFRKASVILRQESQ